jgi:hypothetical protein
MCVNWHAVSMQLIFIAAVNFNLPILDVLNNRKLYFSRIIMSICMSATNNTISYISVKFYVQHLY